MRMAQKEAKWIHHVAARSCLTLMLQSDTWTYYHDRPHSYLLAQHIRHPR